MSTYSGSSFLTQLSTYLVYKGSASAAALNLTQPKIGWVFDVTEGGVLTNGNITVLPGDAIVFLRHGWVHCNNAGADQAIAELSSQFEQLLEEIGGTDFSQFALKTEIPDIPTKTSELVNDSGFLTQHQSLNDYVQKTELPNLTEIATKNDIPTKTSELVNDSGFSNVTVDEELSQNSRNAIENRAVTLALQTKASQTELDTIKHSFIPQIDDLSKYEAQVGEIIQYKGESTEMYEKGHFYEFEGGSSSVTIPANTNYIRVTEQWEDVEKGFYTLQNWSNDELILTIITKQSQQYQADLVTENGVTLPASNLNTLMFGWGYPFREEGTFIRGGRWELSPVEIGDIVWDEEENIYKIKAVEIINHVLFLTLKIEKTAYKGKVKVGNADNFIDIEEALGAEFTCSFNITMSGAYPTFVASNIDDETKKIYIFGNRYYTRKTRLGNIQDFYKVIFPIPISSAHFHFEPLIGGKYIVNTGDDPAVISTKKWTQINVQPTSSQRGGTDNLELFLDSDTSTLILRDKELGVLSAIDFSAFTKDGMLTDAILYNIAEEGIEVETPYLKLIFNTESGQKPIRVSLATLDISFAIDSELSTTSHNAIENRAVTLALQTKASQTELDDVKDDIEDLRHSGAFLPTYDEETETLIY